MSIGTGRHARSSVRPWGPVGGGPRRPVTEATERMAGGWSVLRRSCFCSLAEAGRVAQVSEKKWVEVDTALWEDRPAATEASREEYAEAPPPGQEQRGVAVTAAGLRKGSSGRYGLPHEPRPEEVCVQPGRPLLCPLATASWCEAKHPAAGPAVPVLQPKVDEREAAARPGGGTAVG